MAETQVGEMQIPHRVLLGPGPSSVHPRVLQAMTMPVIGHLDPAFFQVMDDVCNMLREVYHTSNFMTLPISSTGTGAMETACANIIERGDSVIVCRNGFFGDRLADIAQRYGAEAGPGIGKTLDGDRDGTTVLPHRRHARLTIEGYASEYDQRYEQQWKDGWP